jgi:hypothetical protein
MLDGVTIIETVTKNRIKLSLAIVLTVVIVVVCVTAICKIWNVCVHNHKRSATAISAIIIFMCVAMISVVWIGHKTTNAEYIVTIDDNVPYKAFIEKYEVLSRDGDRYRVREVVGVAEQ